MTNNNTRTRLIQLWLVVAVVSAGLWLSGDGGLSASSAIGLITLICAPPVMLFMLWPSVEAPTAGDVIRGAQPPKA